MSAFVSFSTAEFAIVGAVASAVFAAIVFTTAIRR
jgi:hypothetical protein